MIFGTGSATKLDLQLSPTRGSMNGGLQENSDALQYDS
jgi:hypothetical protein